MERRNRGIAALAATFGVLACSEQSPVAPDAGYDDLRMAIQSTPGSYVISFLKGTSSGLAPTAGTEPVGTYLVLKSEVRDNLGNLAQSGTVTYQVCSAKGNYAPSATCNSGGGTWKRFFSGSVDPIGLLVGFGSCSTPRAIGFRLTYSGGGSSGIANGVSASKDFIWAAI
ncbi:MAG TPA: hypothetical protein VES88_01445 [Gemmatimonadaceae bacterium]|nr:hypothetical protein [Gemmatimonadaceae bacterium]